MPRDSLVPEWGQLSGAIQALRDSVTQRRRFTGIGDSEECVEERGLLRDVEECVKSAEESMLMTKTQNSGDPTLSRFPLPPTGILHLPIRNGSSVGSSQHENRADEQPSDDSDGESIADPESDVDVAFTEDAYANIIAHLCRELEKYMSAQDYRRAEKTYKTMEKRYVDREINLNIPFDNRSEQRETLAEIYLKQGRYHKAKGVLVPLLRSEPLEADRKWRLCFLLAHAYYRLRQLSTAEKLARGSLKGRDNLYGKDNPLTQQSAMLVIAIIEEHDDATAMALRGYYCPHTIPPPPPKSALRSTRTAQREREASGSSHSPNLPAESHVPQPRENEEEIQHQSNNHVRWAPDVWASDSGINALTEIGKTKLIEAIYSGDEQWVGLILGRNPSVEAPCVDSISPLMHAVKCEHKGIVGALLTHGAQVDATISGWTALHKATDAGNLAIMQLLLAHNADIEAQAPFECRPPTTAQDRFRAIAQEQPDPTASISFDEKENSWTPLLRAASKGDEAAVRLLLDRGANIHARSPTDGTPLLHACETMHFTTVDLLLMRGSDIHAQDKYGWTPLHRALVKRDPESPALLQRLVDQGCDVNARCNYRKTPLHYAVEKSDGPAVGSLLHNRGDIEARDAAERTPLHTAIECRSEAMVRLLLDLGADAMAMDKDGRDAERAATHAVRRSPEIISLLKTHKQRMKKESSQKKGKEKGPSSRKTSVGEVGMGHGGGAGGDANGGSSTPKRDKSSRLLGKPGSVGNGDAGGDSYGELVAAQTSSSARRDKSIWLLGKARTR
ncbi:MAG: hypothetical protein L6R38_008706 [Xanthoria sp. 2 TBL-2021]|nr:MAG: hypothetical protein L6R38_008706 [Xanthoria sp. 2 TBL-2021]